jgi:hypothetical protein
VLPETRRVVDEVMARLGYVPNKAGHSSARRDTGSVALVVCEDNSRVLSEPFFQLILSSGGDFLILSDGTRAQVDRVRHGVFWFAEGRSHGISIDRRAIRGNAWA